jgi:flagellar motor protein MotB
VKFGTLSAILVLTTIMISTIDLSQNFVFAQNTTSITPASELAGSNDDDSSSSEDNESDNESTDSSSEEDTDSQDTASSEEDTDSQDTASSEEDVETEEDSEQTNPLLEEIRNRVSGALSATGMPGTGF